MLLFSVCSRGVVVSAGPPRSEWLSRAPSLPSAPAESQGLGLGPSGLCRPQPEAVPWVQILATPMLSTRGRSWPTSGGGNCTAFYLIALAGCILFVTGSCYRKYQMFLVEGTV